MEEMTFSIKSNFIYLTEDSFLYRYVFIFGMKYFGLWLFLLFVQVRFLTCLAK